MASEKDKQPQAQGQNPDYYAETASLGPPHPLQGNPTQGAPVQQQQEQQQQQQQQQYNLPPLPGPPPASGNAPQQQAPYFRPPPGASPQQQPQELPAYTPGQGKPPQFPPPPSAGDVPPQLPPRPANASSSSAGTGGKTKPTFGERLLQWSTKAGVPINKVTNKLGSEAFWPTTLDLECDKAARILKSFCKDGFYTTTAHAEQGAAPPAGSNRSQQVGPKGKPKVLVKIPQKAIQTAAGLAIFTTFRTGLHISGAGGSGIVVSRLPNGQWSPPSGFLVHTLGAGFMIGLDIYDCVCVLRTPDAVRAFTHPRVSLGAEIGLVAGPVGTGANVEAAIGKGTKPVWSYMKSRGLYAGVQADGTIIIGRPDANAAFYGQKGISVEQILKGEVPTSSSSAMWPQGAKQLMELLKAVDGRNDYDEGVVKDLSSGPTPGDLGIGDHEEGVAIPEEKAKQ